MKASAVRVVAADDQAVVDPVVAAEDAILAMTAEAVAVVDTVTAIAVVDTVTIADGAETEAEAAAVVVTAEIRETASAKGGNPPEPGARFTLQGQTG